MIRPVLIPAAVLRAEDTAEPISAIMFKAKEMLAMRLCVMHNLYFFNMMEEIRQAIEKTASTHIKAAKLDEFRETGNKRFLT